MPAIHLRTDQTLHSQLSQIASTEGLSLNAYLCRLVRADVARRTRIANAVGLSSLATDAELATALGAVLATPLSAVEQAYMPSEPGAAVAYSAGRARKRSASKPAPAKASKPAVAAKPAPPKQRSEGKATGDVRTLRPKALTSVHSEHLRTLAQQFGVPHNLMIKHALDRIGGGGRSGKYAPGIDVSVAIAIDTVLGLRGSR